MSAELSGRTALVTGATDGIGAAIARHLAAQGAQVVVSGRDAARGNAVVAEIVTTGGAASFVAADLSEGMATIAGLAQAAQDVAGGALDILVNNAAMLIAPGPTESLPERVVDRALSINVKSMFLLTGAVAPGMVARGSGAIVNLGSLNGFGGSAHMALYSATKAAVHALTRSWANEYGPAGVRVNAVAPGPTATAKVVAMADHIAPMIARVPSRRMSTPEEVADAVAFLVGDGAASIHGVTLSVDGGLAASL